MQRKPTTKPREVRPTDEQEAVIRTELKSGDCALINAYAGTGKTTTLELLAKANPKKRILYICFNRETALHAKDRFPENTDCRTIHSLAFALSGAAFRDKLGTPRPLEVMRCLNLTAPHVAVHVIATVERFLHTVDSAIEAGHLPPGAELCGVSPSQLLDEARKLWRLMQEHRSDVPMSHDGYLKLWAMTTPRLAAYDMIFLDEAQDTNPVSLDVVLRQRLHGRTSLVFVGDTHQSIYRWRHAINAMEQLKQIAVATLPLTTSFRFNGDIAEDASLFLNHWKDDMVQLAGRGPASNPMGQVATIARTNAEIIGAAIPRAESGERIHFAGTSERESWNPFGPYNLQVPLDLLWLRTGKKELVQSAYMKAFSSFEQVVEHTRGDDAGWGADVELAKQLALVESYGEALPAVIAMVCRQACSPQEAVMSFSTAHRAKGREWREVQLLSDFFELEKIPPGESSRLKSDADFREEMNLIYVAMTRACESNSYPEDLANWLARQKGVCEENESGIQIQQTKTTDMKDANWVIIDTETDGLADPIHIVEIAAQRMSGWSSVGEKFRVLLNHGVPIPPEATAVHGYTTEFLEKCGEDPLVAHSRFREFVGDPPLVAHNLSFDWNRALFQEWLRLGLEPIGQRGFCTLMLSRRLVDECKSYRLDVLRDTFRLSNADAHRAFADVGALVELFGRVFRPRLEGTGLETFESVADFSKRTPVAKCLCQVKSPGASPKAASQQQVIDRWYFIDAQNDSHGPFTAVEILQQMGAIPCWVWQEGLPDWISSEKCEGFQRCTKTPPPLPIKSQHTPAASTRSVQELVGLCRGLVADGKITTAEVRFLSDWLADAGVIAEWPTTEIAETIERITADGRVAKEEKAELLALLQGICFSRPVPGKHRAPTEGWAPHRPPALCNTRSRCSKVEAGLWCGDLGNRVVGAGFLARPPHHVACGSTPGGLTKRARWNWRLSDSRINVVSGWRRRLRWWQTVRRPDKTISVTCDFQGALMRATLLLGRRLAQKPLSCEGIMRTKIAFFSIFFLAPVADLTSIWNGFLELKHEWDQTGNGVNHPNDFGHRVYAQVITTLLAANPNAEYNRSK